MEFPLDIELKVDQNRQKLKIHNYVYMYIIYDKIKTKEVSCYNPMRYNLRCSQVSKNTTDFDIRWVLDIK